MAEMSEGLADRIRLAAQPIGGVAELARRTGIPLSSLNENLRGRKLSVDRLVAIAQALEVSLDWLAAGEGKPEWRPGRNAEELKGVERPEPAPQAGPDSAAQMRGPADFGTINVKRLATALQVVEERFAAHGRKINAEKKANLAVALYLMVSLENSPSSAEVRETLEKMLPDQP